MGEPGEKAGLVNSSELLPVPAGVASEADSALGGWRVAAA
jgi:hypothetical protein